MTAMNGSNLAAALLLYGTVLGGTSAQAATSPDGAYTQLSPQNQTVAVALFEAQIASPAPGAPRRLTLDDIAARRQSGHGWGEILNEMKVRGLVKADSVAQVMAKHKAEQRRRESARVHLPGGTLVK
ncbi:MAG: hypothetical protein ACREJG_14135 [Candidatus Rokuibacteriota bacterium]